MCNNAFHIFLPSQKADNFFQRQRERKLHFRGWGREWGEETQTQNTTHQNCLRSAQLIFFHKKKVTSHVSLEADFCNFIISLFRWLKKKNSVLHFFIKIIRLFLLFLIQKYKQVISQTSLKNGLLVLEGMFKNKQGKPYTGNCESRKSQSAQKHT